MEPWSRIIENSFSGSCWGLWAKRTMGPSIPLSQGPSGVISIWGPLSLPMAQCILQVNQGRNMGKSVNQEIMGHPERCGYHGYPYMVINGYHDHKRMYGYDFLLSTSHYIHILPGCSVVGLIPSMAQMWDSPVTVTIPRWPKSGGRIIGTTSTAGLPTAGYGRSVEQDANIHLEMTAGAHQETGGDVMTSWRMLRKGTCWKIYDMFRHVLYFRWVFFWCGILVLLYDFPWFNRIRCCESFGRSLPILWGDHRKLLGPFLPNKLPRFEWICGFNYIFNMISARIQSTSQNSSANIARCNWSWTSYTRWEWESPSKMEGFMGKPLEQSMGNIGDIS